MEIVLRFDIYLIASDQQNCEEKRKIAYTVLVPKYYQFTIVLNLRRLLMNSDATDYDTVISKFDEYLIPKKM